MPDARQEAERLGTLARRHKQEERRHRLAAQQARREQAAILARLGIELKQGEGDFHGRGKKEGTGS
ncbi:MAG: hypothetical protein R3D34_06860 [Nitratireductor sp.]